MSILKPSTSADHIHILKPSTSAELLRSKILASFSVDWKETPEAHVFKTDLPGIKKEDVKVEVGLGNILQISGERDKDNAHEKIKVALKNGEQMTGKWHRFERKSGTAMRRFTLPDNVKVDEIKTAMENGVLTVTVPKGEIKEESLVILNPRVYYKYGVRCPRF